MIQELVIDQMKMKGGQMREIPRFLVFDLIMLQGQVSNRLYRV